MIFFLDKQIIDFENFSALCPRESAIISPYLDKDLAYVIEEGRLKLVSEVSNPIFIDIKNKLQYHQRYFYKNSIYNELLAKAIGLKKGYVKPLVWDTTAGMLGDSLLMHAMGCRVISSERNPFVAALIINALTIFPINLEFHFSNALDLEIDANVIFFDPMYQQKNQKVLPKKEMQVFRTMVGEDVDAKTVAEILKLKNKRLVIKRSSKVDPILLNPDIIFTGKSTSYDVYLPKI